MHCNSSSSECSSASVSADAECTAYRPCRFVRHGAVLQVQAFEIIVSCGSPLRLVVCVPSPISALFLTQLNCILNCKCLVSRLFAYTLRCALRIELLLLDSSSVVVPCIFLRHLLSVICFHLLRIVSFNFDSGGIFAFSSASVRRIASYLVSPVHADCYAFFV